MHTLGNSSRRWSSSLRSHVLVPVLLLGALACSSGSSTPVEVLVDPVNVTVAAGESVQLHATVTGTSDTRLQWKVTAGGGSVDDSGLYTAPAEEGSAQVRATSVVNPQSFAHVQVTVKKAPPSLTLLPAARKLGVRQDARFKAQIVNGTGSEQLVWRVEEGSQGGSVTDLGNGAASYLAPATPGTFHVGVSVQSQPELSARATVTVTQEAPLPTLRGTVSYTGQGRGRVYLSFVWGYGSGDSLTPEVSTSLEAPGAYSLHPLQDSSLPSFVLAYMDTAGTGRLNLAMDPMALVPIYLTGEDQVLDLTLADPSQPPPLADLNFTPQAVGSGDSLFIAFGTSYDVGRTYGELADSYKIYWSHQPDPGPTHSVGSRTVTSGPWVPNHGHLVVVPGLPAGQYYVGVAPVRGGVEGGVRALVSAVEVGGAPGAGATLSGKVQLEAPSASGSVYVVAARGSTLLFTRVPMSASTISWSIPGLPEGDYTVWALLDANGDNVLERAAPSIALRPHVTVSGTAAVSAPDLSFVGIPATARLTSLQQNGWSTGGSIQFGGIFYDFSVLAGSKPLVAARLTAGQPLPVPYDVPYVFYPPLIGALAGQEGSPLGLESYVSDPSSAWPVGARLTAEVRYADGSTEPLFVEVPPALPLATLASPIDGAPTSATPTFTWSLPTGLSASLTQRLMVREDNAFGPVVWTRVMPLSQTQVTYNDDGKASALSSGTTYVWQVELSDGQGNFGRASQAFQVQ
ncbi:MAG: hypothetical protein ACJ8AT_31295 [Hyalangium sp.]|uniref:hypothetical protein n=1 Tax=Hyalangium sp. TaxID=2028555 RepID=UPI00389A1D3C